MKKHPQFLNVSCFLSPVCADFGSYVIVLKCRTLWRCVVQKAVDYKAVATSWEDGAYMFILRIEEVKDKSRASDPITHVKSWSLQRQSHTHVHTNKECTIE